MYIIFLYTVVDNDVALDDRCEEPMIAIVYGDNDVVFKGDVFPFEHSLNDITGFGECGLCEERVQDSKIET